MNTAEKIKNYLHAEIEIAEVDIIDESYKHVNHKKDTKGGHFKLRIVSNAFNILSLIERHRLVYKILDSMMKVEIHALSIKALTIEENN
jgi:BolA protein